MSYGCKSIPLFWEAWLKENDLLLWKDVERHKFTLDEIKIICMRWLTTNDELWLESPGNEMCEERKEEIVINATMIKAINIWKTKKIWLRNLSKRYEDSDGSLKKMETLDKAYLWEICQHACTMLIQTRRCHDEKPSQG